ncbi:LexA family transcriptional regulator [Desulfovibrio inopinatus]|uniref:LexA family transcriptional regulator n=1 Tax=Desulfovibrio inopinatus TaxID=102109 RepID=UPI0003F6A4B0|nr:S24 family peptidase [Desulfovibrio inopinatus]
MKKNSTHKTYYTDGNAVDDILGRIKTVLAVKTQTELARLLDVGKQSITDAKKRGRIPADWLMRLGRLKDVNPVWLETGQGTPFLHAEKQHVTGLMEYPGHYHSNDFIYIPLVKAKWSPDQDTLESDHDIESYYAFRREWLKGKGQIAHMRLLRVTGESMVPTLRDDDIVLVDLSQTDILTGKIFAVGIDDEICIKRLDKKPGIIVLISDNRLLYPPIDIEPDNSANVRIIGRVVWMAREAM